MQKKSSFPRSLGAAAIAVFGVLLLQVGTGIGGGQAGTRPVAVLAAGDLVSQTTAPGLDTEARVAQAATDPPTTTVVAATDPPTTAPPPTDPPTTAPPPTDPPTTAPPPTDPPTTAPPPTDPPTTAPATTAPATTAPVANGPTTLPPGATPPTSPPSNPGGGSSVAVGAEPSSSGSGPAAAFKSAMQAVGSTAAAAAERMVLPAVRKLVRLPAVRKLADSKPVAATKKAVALVTEELRDLEPATIVPFLWAALLALLVATGAFLRLWWAPPDWPSSRSLAVGAHRRASQQPRRDWQVGWPASPPALQRRTPGWRPPLPGATGLASRRLPGVGVDVDRLRAAPPPGKPVFTGLDDPDPSG